MIDFDKEFDDFDKKFEQDKKNIIKIGIASMIMQGLFIIGVILIAIYAWKHF